MTLDLHSKRWRNMAKLFLLWVALPEAQASTLIDALPQSEQDRFDAFLLTLQSPRKALRQLETYFKRGHFDTVDAIIGKLERPDLEKLVKAGLKRGKLIDNLPKMIDEDLRELVGLCSYPKGFLVCLEYSRGLDSKTKKTLGMA
jgi:hypothetical protein